MADRYWVPTSWPWRLSVVGSCVCQKAFKRSSNLISAGSKVIWMTSAWPVRPVETASYEGWPTLPPLYPETTDFTPRSRWKTASLHQKQPSPNVAVSNLASDFAADPLVFVVGVDRSADMAVISKAPSMQIIASRWEAIEGNFGGAGMSVPGETTWTANSL